MLIDFNEIQARTLPGMNGGTGSMTARLFMEDGFKIIPCSIHAGGSIGHHSHETSDDINYVLSGEGMAVCDGVEERLAPGICHICRRHSGHSIVNTGSQDLTLITIVIER